MLNDDAILTLTTGEQMILLDSPIDQFHQITKFVNQVIKMKIMFPI